MHLRVLLLASLFSMACAPGSEGHAPGALDLRDEQDAAANQPKLDAASEHDTSQHDAGQSDAELSDASQPAQDAALVSVPDAEPEASVYVAPDAAVVVDPPVALAVQVKVQGLRGTPSSALQLVLNGTSTLQVRDDGTYQFPAGLIEGSSFNVSLVRQPSALAHECTLQAGVGTLTAESAPVEVSCVPLSGLRISEVGSCYYVDSACWIELYNAGSTAEQLSAHQLRTPATLREAPYSRSAEQLFALPALLLQPGQYALVAAESSNALPDGQRVVHVRAGRLLPWWTNDGFVELVSGGRTVDFVRFGDNATSPLTAGNFVAEAAAELPSGAQQYGRALARDRTETDSNSASDWSERAFATPMGPNDVDADDDVDADGIPDVSERPGGKLAGLDLYAMGARVGPRDLFMEIDRMAGSDPALTPRRDALAKLVEVFAQQGIALHFDVGNLFASSFDAANYNLGGGNTVPFSASVGLSPQQTGIADFYAYKAEHMAPERRAVFYYMLFASSQERDGSGGASGIGELFGNDSIITLGGYGMNLLTPRNRNLLTNYQAATMMHELGHNLGLGHGGDESVNNKPNYLSVMNYLYGSLGLPSIGEREGDRYDLTTSCTLRYMSELSHSPFEAASSFLVDYSHGAGADLDERHVRESEGLGQLQSEPVDYDCSGDIADDYTADLNFDGKLQTLHDHDDWQNLQLILRRQVASNDSAPSLLRLYSVADDLTVDDRQPLIPEPCPPALLHTQ